MMALIEARDHFSNWLGLGAWTHLIHGAVQPKKS